MPKCKPISQTDRERFYMLKVYGCMACRKRGLSVGTVEIHHIVEGYRLGHDHTIPLCIWHHRGERENLNITMSKMKAVFGPSMAREKKLFVREFGSERELLEEINGWLNRNHIKEGERKGLAESASFFPF